MSRYVIEWETSDGEWISFRRLNKDDVIALLMDEIAQLTETTVRVRFPDGSIIET